MLIKMTIDLTPEEAKELMLPGEKQQEMYTGMMKNVQEQMAESMKAVMAEQTTSTVDALSNMMSTWLPKK